MKKKIRDKKINRIILHVGCHKTGTSSIQKALAVNQKYLASCGVITTSKTGQIGTTKDMLNVTLTLATETINCLEHLECDTLVLSNENYSWLSESESDSFVKTLRDYTDKVEGIIYLRRQDKLAISHKQQGAKSIKASVAYGHELRALPSMLSLAAQKYLNFHDKVCCWKNLLDDFVVRRFEPTLFHEGQLIYDFLHLTKIDQSIDTKSLELPNNMNESISRENQLFLHQTRGHFPEKSKIKHLITPIIAKEIGGSDIKLMPSKAEAKAFYDQFREGNERLKALIGMDDEAPFFEEDFSMYPDIANASELTSDELCEIFAKLIKVIEKRLPSNNKHKLQTNQLRDLAIKLSSTDLETASSLMRIAHEMRPQGEFIKRKLDEFDELLIKAKSSKI